MNLQMLFAGMIVVGFALRIAARSIGEKGKQDRHAMDERMWQIMERVCAEWESDPESRYCFDIEIVEESIALVKKRREKR